MLSISDLVLQLWRKMKSAAIQNPGTESLHWRLFAPYLPALCTHCSVLAVTITHHTISMTPLYTCGNNNSCNNNCSNTRYSPWIVHPYVIIPVILQVSNGWAWTWIIEGWEPEWPNPPMQVSPPPNMRILLKCILLNTEISDHLLIWYVPFLLYVLLLHSSCNFQYWILGWSTLVLSPSDTQSTSALLASS